MKKFYIATVTILIQFLFASVLFAESDKIKVKGDFRYRHETIDKEDKDARNRHRIRARIGIEGKVNDEIKVGVRISSGKIVNGGGDPISSNETLSDGFTTKSLGLDLAYVSWKPAKVEGLELKAGKMKNPYLSVQKSKLLWDSDLNPEGLAAKYSRKMETVEIFLNGGFFWIMERSSDDDSYFAGGQAGLKFKLMEGKGHLTIGAGYYDYANTQGFPAFIDNSGSGNSLDTSGIYFEDYDEVDVFIEAGTMIENIPVSIFGDFVTNTAADDDNTGWLVGTTIGNAKKTGTWKFRYQYKKLEKDAVLGAYTDSDFIGGGTDGKGHEISFSIAVMNNTTIGATLFVNKIGLDDDDEKDYKRFQGDLKFSF